MADDLGDEWWLSKEISSKKKDVKKEIKVVAKEKKRKIEHPIEISETQQKKKKKKKKNLTQVLKESEPRVTTPEDLISTIQKHYHEKLSTVEWEDIALDSAHNFFECGDASHTSVSYLKTIFPKWAKLKTESDLKPGSPLLLIVTSSALRAVELNRSIELFKGEKCKTAKLFAKHFKLEEQVKFLSKNNVHIGIGTPNRIHSLLQNGCLQPDSLRGVVLDWNWRDVKLRRLIDVPEIRADLMSLCKTYVIPHVRNAKCKIGLL